MHPNVSVLLARYQGNQAVDQKSRSFPLRLPASLRVQADDFSDREGISLNQFISIAVAEKVGRMEEQARTEKDLTPAARDPFPAICKKQSK
jgi:hypothetical protein